jgi:hypothetical protein
VVEPAVGDDGEVARDPADRDVVEEVDVVLAGVLVGVVDSLDRVAVEIEDRQAAVLERSDDEAGPAGRGVNPDRRIVGIDVVGLEERLRLEGRPDDGRVRGGSGLDPEDEDE